MTERKRAAAAAAAAAAAQAQADAKKQAAIDAQKRADAEKAALLAAQADYPGKELGFKRIDPPPLPINAAKQAHLDALLESYKADKISSEEYHTQRAAILAAP